ncbi:hypothetical protein K402DRAFT_398342 [Aulographum hederae CBS 113979]|uniref:FAD/NAD(P)-binding domain-containing protein n=1 Tax=Aulographum hederae CBS 113979 TaxID=1176131 RepID=A0A6G1GL92_9PEZI|nr:hypothetical protein K402DRAFT_398342 [Aulographum hederae CBS 113979]
MMKLSLRGLFLFLFLAFTTAAQQYDVIVLSATPGGITSAVAAARLNKTVLLLERTKYIGGLPANGLGATDIITGGTAGGLFKDFTDRIVKYYTRRYGEDSAQVRDCHSGFHFEPEAASAVFGAMIKEHPSITVQTQRQFDFQSSNVTKGDDGAIKSIKVTNLEDNSAEEYSGKFFIDGTYEGDLVDAAGVPFLIGRESNETYQEPGAGVTYKLWLGPECEGTTHQEDDAIQSYNYRLLVTNDTAMRVKIEKPDSYNRTEFLSLVDDVESGITVGAYHRLTTEQLQTNMDLASHGQKPSVNTLSAQERVINHIRLPNNKFDANNQALGFISTDLPAENHPWPTANWTWRDNFAARLRSYTLGLIYFAQNDEAMPSWFREEFGVWGLTNDSYVDNGFFPRQVYVREGKRMNGTCFFTAHDALPVDGINGTALPPIHSDSVAAAHYYLDSHAVRKREKGRCGLDGSFQYPTKPYTVPYEVMVPISGPSNLLAPVPASGSHMGFATLRLEPTWMALGQAAGIAASMAIDGGLAAKDVDVGKLQATLLDDGAVLYYEDSMKGCRAKGTCRDIQEKALGSGKVGCGLQRHIADVQELNSKDKLSGGAIAGIVVGVVAAVALIVLAVFFLLRRKRKARGAVNEKSGYGEHPHLDPGAKVPLRDMAVPTAGGEGDGSTSTTPGMGSREASRPGSGRRIEAFA